jgi:hypothetical protein
MGKKAKEHRRKVAARNQRLDIAKKKFEKEYLAAMEAKVAEIKEKFANLSEEEVNIALNKDVEDATIVEETLPDQEG